MKKPFYMIAVPGMMFAVSACSTTGMSTGRGATAQGATEAPVGAQAAVFEEIFRSNASGLQANAASFCIATGADRESNATNPDVLAALRGNPKVKPAAACEVNAGGNGVVDRQSRQPSLMFHVRTESCVSATDCLISGGYYEGNLSSQTNRYRARLVNGTWTVSLDEMGPVS